jgi:hypothetical protein
MDRNTQLSVSSAPVATSRLGEIVAPLLETVRRYDTVFVANGALLNFAQQPLFGQRRVVRSASLDADRIRAHLRSWRDRPSELSADSAVLSGLPRTAEELAKLGFSAADWDNWRSFDAELTQATPAAIAPERVARASKAGALNALTTTKNVVFIVAHSDGFSIKFPGGESLDIQDLDTVADALRANRPRVVLFSCETARVANTNSFAKALLDRGAEVVLAPVTKISVADALRLYGALMSRGGDDDISLGDAFDAAVRETGISVLEAWVVLALTLIRIPSD